MDSFKFQDIKLEKSNAMSKHRNMQRVTTFFRFIELVVFLIIVSKLSTKFVFSFPLSTEHFHAISLKLISPKFVFLIGNAIILALFLISGQFSTKNGEKARTNDFYEEYVQKCRLNQHVYTVPSDETEKVQKCRLNQHAYTVPSDETEKVKMVRSKSQSSVKAKVVPERRRELRRTVTEKCQKNAVTKCGTYKEDEMSGDEFRRTVEAFIARQQRCLREDLDQPSKAVVSL